MLLYTRGGDRMATKKPRYMISVNNDMFQAIEDFRFNRRFQTRSAATAELIRIGIEALKKDEAQNITPTIKSGKH